MVLTYSLVFIIFGVGVWLVYKYGWQDISIGFFGLSGVMIIPFLVNIFYDHGQSLNILWHYTFIFILWIYIVFGCVMHIFVFLKNRY